MTPVTIRTATPADAALLAGLGARTFRDAFGPENEPADVERHVAATHAPAVVAANLADPAATVLLAFAGLTPVGYAALRAGSAIGSVRADAPLELERLYVEHAETGGGVGSALMAAVLARAEAGAHDAVWLGVWERNVHAVRFYERWGFAAVGEKAFVVGVDVQRDVVMARPVTRA